MKNFLLTVAVLLLLATQVLAEQVVFTQLLHRHGARTPLPPVNQSQWCSADGCGVLTNEGVQMLLALGTFLRDRYSALSPTYFTTTTYNSSEVYSRSSNVIRTVLSAEAMLLGLYPNTSNPFLPVVNTAPLATDTLLNSNAVMSCAMQFELLMDNGQLRPLMLPVLHKYFGDPTINATVAATLAAIAKEAHFQGLCDMIGFEVCLGYVQGLTESVLASGGGAAIPTCVANRANLAAIMAEMNAIFYGYNISSTLDQLRGSSGQPLAQEMLGNFNAYMTGTMPYSLMHYSAHDTTVTPLAVTLGDYSLYLPVYGQVIILDLLEDGGAYYVRGIKGAPLQAPGPHTYTTEPLQLGGIDSSGRTYYINGSTDRMPIADFARFVDSTKATSSQGICYISGEVAAYYSCSSLGAPPSPTCSQYRLSCPQYSCDSTSYLALPSYDCVAFPIVTAVAPTTSSASSSSGLDEPVKLLYLVISAIIAILIGFLLGFIVSLLATKRRRAKAYDSTSLVEDVGH